MKEASFQFQFFSTFDHLTRPKFYYTGKYVYEDVN